MNVLITGCDGQVGQAVTTHLIKNGYAVRGIDRAESCAADIDYRSCDLLDAQALSPHIKGVDAVLHLAAIPSPGRAPNAEIFQLSNFLLVTGKTPTGDPEGVSPDIARAVADRLGVPVQYISYATPGELADAATEDLWDIGNIGAEPERAKTIAFTAAYAEIEATYLVPADSPIQSVAEVDREGMRIGVYGRSAYGLWLSDHIERAELVKTDGVDSSFDVFVERKLEALAGLRPRLNQDVEKLPGARILDGQFSSVQQAIGTKPDRPAAAAFLREFVEEAKTSGLVKDLIEKHGVVGSLTVAPPA